MALDGKTCAYKVTNKQIEIKPGMDIHDNYRYNGEGHQQAGQKSSNLYVNFQLAPPNWRSDDFEVTSRYTRQANDLHYKKRIALQDAIKCNPVKIPLLNGKTILLAIDETITPKTIKKIPGEGMKVYKKKDYMDEHNERGDLYVSFEIVFPSKLNNE